MDSLKIFYILVVLASLLICIFILVKVNKNCGKMTSPTTTATAMLSNSCSRCQGNYSGYCQGLHPVLREGCMNEGRIKCMESGACLKPSHKVGGVYPGAPPCWVCMKAVTDFCATQPNPGQCENQGVINCEKSGACP